LGAPGINHARGKRKDSALSDRTFQQNSAGEGSSRSGEGLRWLRCRLEFLSAKKLDATGEIREVGQKKKRRTPKRKGTDLLRRGKKKRKVVSSEATKKN